MWDHQALNTETLCLTLFLFAHTVSVYLIAVANVVKLKEILVTHRFIHIVNLITVVSAVRIGLNILSYGEGS